jgi:hypothetical protein
MCKKSVIRFLLSGLVILVFIQSILPQTSRQDDYLTIDQITGQLEKRFQVQFFYKPEWFEKRNFHSSILELPLDEILDRIQTAAELSVVAIDSVLYVFLPLKPAPLIVPGHDGSELITIGDLNNYGKYSKATLHGKILDGKNGSPLPGASILVDKVKRGAHADERGNYTLQLPVGEYALRMSFMGYEENVQKIRLAGDGTFNAELFEKTVQLNEVVISSQRAEANVSGTQMSVFRLDSRAIRELPATLGENDIIKSVTLMPGVQTIGEFGTGFNVRGGSADQNLILLEDVPLFSTSHLFGLISVVNSDGISNVTLLKAGIPAKYGERASSVMDIQMGTNNENQIRVKGGIGLINSRLYIETPMFNKKITLSLGARSSYSDWLLHQIPDIDLMNSSAKFYDANAFLTYTLNPSNKINLFAYLSNDRFGFSKNTDYRYGNLLASFRWKHTFNSNLYFNLVSGISRYQYQVTETDTMSHTNAYRINSSLVYNNLKGNFTWLGVKNHAIDFGVNAAIYRIKPGELKPSDSESLVVPVTMHDEKGVEYALYLSDNITLSQKLSVDAGMRYTLYTYLGPNKVYVYQTDAPRNSETIMDSVTYGNNQTICWYSGLEPRIVLRFTLSENSSVKMSYNRIHQYVNLVSNTAVMTPSDVWKLSSPNLRPLTSDHYSIGYYRNFKNNAIETSVELYYKSMVNAIDYKNGAQILLNPYLESDLVNVKGNNYGIELFVKKNLGRLTGWASYTYSRSFHQTNSVYEEEKINNNQTFPSNYDKPNNLIVNASYHVSKRWRFGASFTYSTGRPVTLPELKYNYQGYQMIYYSDRSKYRLPDYHRLDLSITLDESLRIRKKWKGSWSFSVINVYGRNNAYSVFYKKEDHFVSGEFKQYDTYMLYIIGRPLPTLTYNFYF